MLTHRVYADYLQEYGRMALALDKRLLWMAQRLFWFTVEFGLIETVGGLRIYGAGIASSAGESLYALESEAAERRPFDLLTLLRRPLPDGLLRHRWLGTAIRCARTGSGFGHGASAGPWPLADRHLEAGQRDALR